jgi:hypothetical protein
MADSRHPFYLLPALLFLLPINVYLIGNGFGSGIQWALFRYQMTSPEPAVFSWTQDLLHVTSNGIFGTSATAILLWTLATLLLLAWFAVAVWAAATGTAGIHRNAALILPVSGLLFLISDIVQYGLFLQVPGGQCIPMGVPVIIAMGVWGFWYGYSIDVIEKAGSGNGSREKKEDHNAGWHSWSAITRHKEIVTLVLISLAIKVIAFFTGLLPNLPLTVILGDTKLYYWYATSLTWGQVPYSSYYVPYPQFFYIPLLIALVPALLVTGYSVYLYSFAALMVIVDTANLVLVFLIADHLWGKKRAFTCGLLAATAISAAFFVSITYDAVPVFLLLLSLWMYLGRRHLAGYLLATAGVLTKWFPFFALPYYILHDKKTGKTWSDLKTPLLLSTLLVLVTVVPFLLINAEGALKTYTVHFGRTAEVNSFVCYLDTICRTLLGFEPVQSVSFLFVIAGELALLYWYYRSPGSRPLALIGCIVLSILIFVIFNKVFSTNYIIWLTPFFALFLSGMVRHVILFYAVQVIMYLETPVLFGIIYAPFNFGYDEVTRYTVMVQSLPGPAFVFYSVKFLLFFLVVLAIVMEVKRDMVTGPDPASKCGRSRLDQEKE